MTQSSTGGPPDIYFLHIQKTAGTSVASVIRRAYAEEEEMPAYECPDLGKVPLPLLNSYSCYMGHCGTSLFSLLEREVSTVTVLRDPFERSVSHLLHVA